MHHHVTPCCVFSTVYHKIAKRVDSCCNVHLCREDPDAHLGSIPLGSIDAIEIVNLPGTNVSRVDPYMSAAADAPRIRLVGADAQRIAILW